MSAITVRRYVRYCLFGIRTCVSSDNGIGIVLLDCADHTDPTNESGVEHR